MVIGSKVCEILGHLSFKTKLHYSPTMEQSYPPVMSFGVVCRQSCITTYQRSFIRI